MFFQKQIDIDPGQLAITDLTQNRSWLQLRDNAFAIAHYLKHEVRLSENDHLAIVMGNSVDFIEVLLGGIIAGCWVTPVNTHLVGDEVDYIVQDSGAKVVIFDSENAHLINVDAACQCISIAKLNADCKEKSSENSSVNCFLPDSPAGGTMLYTSGTTGRPKGVKRNKPATLEAAFSRMRDAGLSFGLSGQGPHLVTGPLYHAAPMLLALYDLMNGAPMIILPKWDTRLFLETVERYAVVTSHLVPTMFVRLLNYKKDQAERNFVLPDIGSLKTVLHGAAPIAPVTKREMIKWWGPILIEYWGASEAGITTMVNSEEWLEHPGTVGKALPQFQVYVGDSNGSPLADSEGALYCRHSTLSQVFEYHHDAEKTKKAHPKPHVFCIGDIGRVDAEGYVYLSGRESNMIISGGVNIYPAEVEKAIMAFPGIVDVVVYGVPNGEWGEEVKALVQLEDPDAVNIPTLLTEFLKNKIAKYKIPRTIECVSALPRTPSGKIAVHQLEVG